MAELVVPRVPIHLKCDWPRPAWVLGEARAKSTEGSYGGAGGGGCEAVSPSLVTGHTALSSLWVMLGKGLGDPAGEGLPVFPATKSQGRTTPLSWNIMSFHLSFIHSLSIHSFPPTHFSFIHSLPSHQSSPVPQSPL